MKNNKYDKIKNIWLNVFPIVFLCLSIVLSFVNFVLIQLEFGDTYKYKNELRFTNMLNGNPQIIAFIGILLLIPCFFIVPKTIYKKRKNGDGLGIMFMPLGLLGIYHILSAIENDKDLEIGIIYGLLLFVISGLATFKKYIKYVNGICMIMILVGLFTLLAGFMPYCFNKTPFLVEYENGQRIAFTRYYYISYYIRDIFLLLSFGTFCDKISNKYAEMK